MTNLHQVISTEPLFSAMFEVHAVLAHRPISRAEALTAVLRGKAFDQLRVWVELFLPAVKLTPAVQHNLCASLNRVYGSANLDGLVNQTLNIAYGFGVATQIKDKKMTIGIGRFRTAYVKEMNAVRRIYDAINVRCDADILVDMFQSIFRRDASVFR